ncbi:type II secretion system F family protein [Dongia deserti]|uniref:type II secretion system F family protein n=1 Tax=Dongia deserti TaxID=2268030 RepID=UPI000E64D93C|nr:type II secretion system F family protein [Dongia deserti]
MTDVLALIGLAPDDALRLAFLATVFFAVCLAVYGVSALWSSSSAVRRRMGVDVGVAQGAKARTESLSYLDEATRVSPVISPIVRRLMPTDMTKISLLRRRLVCAGYYRPSAVGFYYAARIGLAVLFVILFAFAAPIISTRIPDHMIPVLGLVGAAISFYFPDLWIARRTRSLQMQYREGFPDALDLLVVCVEAGLSLDAAINRVGQEIGHAHPALAENFAMMALELRAGESRADALRNLAERMGIDEVRSMVTLLLQSEELGTSVADALRLYADDMRTMRMLRAETKAHALPVKLALPLGFFVFPTMLIVILLPVMIRIYRLILYR